jgi:hypothetical protein
MLRPCSSWAVGLTILLVVAASTGCGSDSESSAPAQGATAPTEEESAPATTSTEDTATDDGSTSSGIGTVSVPVETSRGYTFELAIGFKVPASVETQPGYDVGDTNVVFGMDEATLSVTNTTPGRELSVFPDNPAMLHVAVIWKVPGGFNTGPGLPQHQYVSTNVPFGTGELLTVPEGGTAQLEQPEGISAGDVRGTSDSDADKIAAATARQPAYVAVIADGPNLLSGYWDDQCNLVAVTMGSGRKLDINGRVCKVVTEL